MHLPSFTHALALLTFTTRVIADFVPTSTTNSLNVTLAEVSGSIRAGDSHVFEVDFDLALGGVYYASMELMAGTIGNGTSEDIIGYAPPPALSGVFIGFAYVFPQSLQPGPYYARLNVTTTDTSGNSANLTLEGAQLSLTSYQFVCTTPPAYTPITSIADPNYSSFFLLHPAAGEVLTIPTHKKSVPLNPANYYLGWDYSNYNNQYGVGIDNLSFEFIRQSDRGNGSIYNATYDGAGMFPVPATVLSFNYPLSTAGLITGQWRLRAQYTNAFENNGANTTYISEPFYIAGDSSKCFGLSKFHSSSGYVRSSIGMGEAIMGGLAGLGLALALV